MVAGDTRCRHRHHRRGRDAPYRSSYHLGARGCAPVLEVRGDEPDGLVQGPRHDGGHEPGCRGGEPGLRLRLDGKHRGLGRRLRREGRHKVLRCGARGQDRAGQSRPGPRARRRHSPDRGQLRRSPPSLARTRRGTRRRRPRQLGEPRPNRGPEDGRLRGLRSPRRPPDALVLPVGNAGNITAYWKGFSEWREAGYSETLRECSGFRPRAHPRWSQATTSRTPRRWRAPSG